MRRFTVARASMAMLYLLLLLSSASFLSVTTCSAQLSESELIPPGRLRFNEMEKVKIPKKEVQTIADLFPPVKLDFPIVEAVSLAGLKIPGLSEKDVAKLGLLNFLVQEDGTFLRSADLYASLKDDGKPTIVTVDSIMHPYFAFSNAAIGAAIESRGYFELRSLLIAMINSSILDFRSSEDEEVKDDIQRNLAFLSLGLRLLEPTIRLPDIGGAQELVDNDFELLMAGDKAVSPIFGTENDYSLFAPWGWMCNSEKVNRFARSYHWLSRMSFPLSDLTRNSASGGGNLFRRSILLYRSLVLAPVDKERGSAFQSWERLRALAELCGIDNDSRLRTILPPELTPVLSASSRELAPLLHQVSQPLSRAKLLLSIRQQRPRELSARSIFEMQGKRGLAEEELSMRLFPVIQPPEWPWLDRVAPEVAEVSEGPQPLPLSLLVLHSRGSPLASKLLGEQIETLDQRLLSWMPYLIRVTRFSNLPPEEQWSAERRWSIISSLFAPVTEADHPALKGEPWSTRQLETAMAAWLDSYMAYAPIENNRQEINGGKSNENIAKQTENIENTSQKSKISRGEALSAADSAKISSSGSNAQENKASGNLKKKAVYHYLEPRLKLYAALSRDCRMLLDRLHQIGCLSEDYAARGRDFSRLFERLQTIAKKQIEQQPLNASDFNLLAGISNVLAVVDNSQVDSIFVGKSSAASQKERIESLQAKLLLPELTLTEKLETKSELAGLKNAGQGVNFGIGKVATLYALLSSPAGPMLCRGAVYTLHEVPGGPLERKHWIRKADYGLLRPAHWAAKYRAKQ